MMFLLSRLRDERPKVNDMSRAATGLSREDSIAIIEILVNYKSLPFLELAARSGLSHKRMNKAIEELESQGFVRVVNPNNPVEEIITLKEKGFAMAKERCLVATP